MGAGIYHLCWFQLHLNTTATSGGGGSAKEDEKIWREAWSWAFLLPLGAQKICVETASAKSATKAGVKVNIFILYLLQGLMGHFLVGNGHLCIGLEGLRDLKPESARK